MYNKLKGEYDGYAEIDNNQPFGQSPTIKEQKNAAITRDRISTTTKQKDAVQDAQLMMQRLQGLNTQNQK